MNSSSVSSSSSRTQEASEGDQFKAATAVVDAAICFQVARGIDPISPERRKELIEAVFRDPSFTPYLFEDHFYVQM